MILNQMALFMCFRMSACPGIYKIGMTKHSPEVRAKEISASTGVPKPFKVIAAFHSNNPASDEKLIHKTFAKEA